MTLYDDADLLAAEFVLGSLDTADRAAAKNKAANEIDFAAAVKVWERRLGPLNELAMPRDVPGELWKKISPKLSQVTQLPRDRSEGMAGVAALLAKGREVRAAEKLKSDVRRWRVAAIAASLVAVLLAAYLGVSSFRNSSVQPIPDVTRAIALPESPTRAAD